VSGQPRERVGVVLMGGGARGAYEAGALSVLGPALERRGQRPTIFVGSSVGAINAVAMASMGHLSADEAARRGVERWSHAVKASVLRPLLAQQVPRLAARYAARLAAPRRVRVKSILDPTPLGPSLRRWIDWRNLHRNVGSRLVESVAVTATDATTGRTVAFVERSGRGVGHRSHAIEYLPTQLTVEHLLASSAMPMLFPAVAVDGPSSDRAWYLDGSTRLHNPLKPALDLGTERLVVIGTTPLKRGTDTPARQPALAAGALCVLNGLLEDSLYDDVRALANVNQFFAAVRPGTEAAVRFRRARGKPPYREVPYLLIAPSRQGAIADVAAAVFDACYRGRRALRSPDLPLLARALGDSGPMLYELLSYFLFDSDFTAELIEMGRRDAHRVLASAKDDEGPWRTEPPAALLAA
jgi:NTE family protein